MNLETGEIREYSPEMDNDPNRKQIPKKLQKEAEQLRQEGKSGFVSPKIKTWASRWRNFNNDNQGK